MIQSKGFGTEISPSHWANRLLRERSLSISQDTFMGDPSCDFKVFIQCEPPSIINLIPELIQKQHFFDLIIAWHPDILKHCPSAVKVEFGTGGFQDNFVKRLQNEVSFITTNKAITEGHKLRQSIFNLLQPLPSINDFKIRSRRTPPRIETLDEIYVNAKFNICVENSRYENYFTEKVMNCFGTLTVPIYWGAPNIGEYFNEKGMIIFNNIEELKHILTSLTPEKYATYMEGMVENYKLHRSYRDYDTRIIEEIDKALVAQLDRATDF